MVLVFDAPWRFVLKVKPNMITQMRIIVPELVKEENEIDNYLKKNGLDYKMYKIINGHCNGYLNWKGHEKMKYKSLFITESIPKLLGIEKNN